MKVSAVIKVILWMLSASLAGGLVMFRLVAYSYLAGTKPDEKLLAAAKRRIHQALNRFRSSMNSFVIAVGSHVKPLSALAIAAAKKIGVVSVDKGDTKCKVPSAVAFIEKAAARGCIGEKRKSARC
jgi:hypothetical protein